MRKCFQLLLLGFLFCGTGVRAQTESTLYFMNSIPQVVDVNPAIMPRYRMTIGLPVISSIGAVYTNNGFSYNDIITKADGVVKADLSKLTKSMTDKNYMTLAAHTDLFRFGMRISPKLYLTTTAAIKGYNRTMVPLGLISLLVDGTAPLVGTYSNTSPEEEAISFAEAGVGMAFKVNDNLTLGGKVKYLKGVSNVTTESSSPVVQVNDNYEISATGNARVRTSGVAHLETADDHISDYLKNNGWAIDLGATYKVMDKLTIGASVTDIGAITWKNDTYQYTMDSSRAKYTFSGMDLNKLVNNNTNYFEGQLDSIKNKFEMRESSSGSYSTMLPAKFYFSGNYQLPMNFTVGLLVFNEKFRNRFSSGITAAATKQVGKWLSTSLSYTVSNRSYNNIGVGLSFNFSPVQLYVVGDNLLRAPASLAVNQSLDSYLNSSQLLTFRAGLNLVFGWDKGTTKKVGKGDSGIPKNQSSNTASPQKMKVTVGPAPKKSKKRKVAADVE